MTTSLPFNEFAPIRIESELAEFEPFAGRSIAALRNALRTADHGADPREKLPRIERLRNVVIRAHFKSNDAVGVFRHGGEKNNRRPAAFAQVAEKRKAVLARHHDIENKEIEGPGLQMPARLGRIRRRCNAHAMLDEKLRKQIADVLVIVDDENMKRGLHGLSFGLCLDRLRLSAA